MDCSTFCVNFEPIEEEPVPEFPDVSPHPVGSIEYMRERERARDVDWWVFRNAATNAANQETKKLILAWWGKFRVLKYGEDRVDQYGRMNCRLPVPTDWEPIDAEIWLEEKMLSW